jgi:hypothetical protein
VISLTDIIQGFPAEFHYRHCLLTEQYHPEVFIGQGAWHLAADNKL